MTASTLADFMTPAARQLHARLLDRRSDLVAAVRAARFDALAELHAFGLVDVDVYDDGADAPACMRIVVRLDPGDREVRDSGVLDGEVDR